MVCELRLINLDPNDHINILLPEPILVRDESVDGFQRLYIDVDIEPSFNIHDQISQQVGFDNLGRKRPVDVDYIRTIQPVGPEMLLDILHVVAVGQNFVSIIRIFGDP